MMCVSESTLKFLDCFVKRRRNLFSSLFSPFSGDLRPYFMEFLHKFWLFSFHLCLQWRRYINLRIAVDSVYSIYFNLCFHLYYMLKIPAYQHRYIMDACSSNVCCIRQILFRNNPLLNISIPQLRNLIAIGQKFNIACCQRLFKLITFGFLGRAIYFFNEQFSAIKHRLSILDKFKEFFCRYFLFRFIAIQPVYDRGVYIYSHSIKLSRTLWKVKIFSELCWNYAVRIKLYKYRWLCGSLRCRCPGGSETRYMTPFCNGVKVILRLTLST
jgi:hypothetical protein